jgi:hypothetical protein
MAGSRVIWARNSGQNGWDPVIDVPLNQSVSSRNVHLYKGGLGTRRGGSSAEALPNPNFTAPIQALIESLQNQDEGSAELFAVDNSAPPNMYINTLALWVQLTLADAVQSTPTSVSAATVNGKLYLAYDSTVNRLHVLDPGYAGGGTVRRAGMGTPAVSPLVGNGGGVGTYPAVLRYYRVAFAEQRSGINIRWSLLGPSISFTPDGAHANVTVTKPATISEGETHWALFGSADNILYYYITAATVATTTIADTSIVGYSGFTPAPTEGQFTAFPSVKSLGTDGSRLYGMGVWETAAGDSLPPKPGRFYYGPVQNSTTGLFAADDDERINNTTTLSGWIDLSRNANAADRGVTPHPINNVIYAFLSSGVYALYPTESSLTPYRRVTVSNQIGNLAQQAIVMAVDRNGTPCCYFCDSTRGPHVIGGADGLRWCGKDVIDIWTTINRTAAPPVWGLWFPDRNQVWFGIATGANTSPDTILVLDVTSQAPDQDGDLRGGWTVYDGDLAKAPCAVLFSNTLGAARSALKTPYTGGNSKLLRYDELLHNDAGTNFQAYVQSGSVVEGIQNVRLDKAWVVADASSGVTVRQTLTRNAGDETRTSDLVLTPSGSESLVLVKAEDAAVQDAWTLQVQLGDSAAQNVGWRLHQWQGRITGEMER